MLVRCSQASWIAPLVAVAVVASIAPTHAPIPLAQQAGAAQLAAMSRADATQAPATSSTKNSAGTGGAADDRSTVLTAQQERKAAAEKQMLGAWMLERFEHSTDIIPAEDVRGCALVSDGFLMIEMNARKPSNFPIGEQWTMLYQSGLYQFVFEDDKRITCSTIMGHGNFSGEFQYESAGTPRQFDVEVGAYNLVLTRPDSSRLVFRRMNPSTKLSDDTLKKMEEIRAQRGNR